MPPSATFTVVHPRSAEASDALAQYVDELRMRFDGGFDTDEGVEESESHFVPPAGLFFVVRVAGDVGACGALRWLSDETAEIKRMWVSPARRGQGLGTHLLRHLESEATHAGRSRIVLDTHASLTEAIALYRSQGYTEIPRYNDNPYAERWFEKRLR